MLLLASALFALHCSDGDAPPPPTGGAPDSGGAIDAESGDDGTAGSDVVDAFSFDSGCVARLVAIDLVVPPCDVPLPDAPQLPPTFRPNAMAIKARSGPSGDTTHIARVDSASGCGWGGWFYDDAIKPTRVTLCPPTCNALSLPGSRLDFLFGCQGIPVPP